MMIVFLYFTMALDMDMFVVGQDCILPSSKYFDLHFFLNSKQNYERFQLFVPQA